MDSMYQLPFLNAKQSTLGVVGPVSRDQMRKGVTNQHVNRSRILVWSFLLLASQPWVALPLNAQDHMIDQLTVQGLRLTETKSYVLPVPQRWDTSEETVREKIAGKFGWERFTKNSVVSPIWMDLDSIQDAQGERIGHSLHFRFVVHASLDRLRDRDWMGNLFGDQAKSESPDDQWQELNREDLIESGTKVKEGLTYGWASVPLMNRVMLRGIIASESVDLEDKTTLSWQVLNADQAGERRQATWSAMQRDQRGQIKLQEPSPYEGAGGYLHLQSLEPFDPTLSDACLIEGRVVLHEPAEWFGSNNFLRSKFPLMVQEAVRKFRRRLR